MSEFIKRIQDRLKRSEQAIKQGSSDASKPGKPYNAHSAHSAHGSHGAQNALLKSLSLPTPASTTKGITYLLMLACAVSVTYWIMRIAQIPGTPSQPTNGISKGITLYTNQDATIAYGLFGSKPLATENIYLRGVVATSKNPDGTLDGFAIFEIDGKPTNAISVGETFGKGLSLQSIGDETATLLYQGQKLNFKLNKAKSDKADKGSSSNKSDNTKK